MPMRSCSTALLLALASMAALPGRSLAAPPPQAAAVAASAPPNVAGFAPDRRPANAPSLREATVSPALLAWRLHGVEQPIPSNVMLMAQQGSNWYSPFFRPGMTGPYDLRHWHGPLGAP